MKQTSKQHLRFALEMLVFTIFPIMETAKTPIVLGQIYVLFFLCVDVCQIAARKRAERQAAHFTRLWSADHRLWRDRSLAADFDWLAHLHARADAVQKMDLKKVSIETIFDWTPFSYGRKLWLFAALRWSSRACSPLSSS